VVHEWALQVLACERKAELSWLAVTVVGNAVPESEQREYWIVQQRLMPHAGCCDGWIKNGEGVKYCLEGNESEIDEIVIEYFNTVNNLGLLYADQGKLNETEKMYLRALEGYEKALSVDHTLTLNIINNLGLLYAD
jgi:tetratricopeptide (TPR) repeat protein